MDELDIFDDVEIINHDSKNDVIGYYLGRLLCCADVYAVEDVELDLSLFKDRK